MRRRLSTSNQGGKKSARTVKLNPKLSVSLQLLKVDKLGGGL